jgi:hypothetical protein
MERKKEATKPNSSATMLTLRSQVLPLSSFLPSSLSLSLSSLALLAVNIFAIRKNKAMCSWSVL